MKNFAVIIPAAIVVAAWLAFSLHTTLSLSQDKKDNPSLYLMKPEGVPEFQSLRCSIVGHCADYSRVNNNATLLHQLEIIKGKVVPWYNVTLGVLIGLLFLISVKGRGEPDEPSTVA